MMLAKDESMVKGVFETWLSGTSSIRLVIESTWCRVWTCRSGIRDAIVMKRGNLSCARVQCRAGLIAVSHAETFLLVGG
jgi:hypothetical protein